MASSSSSLIRTCKYRVFVSFSGQDVRKTFLSHLRKQFKDNGITMYNDQEMERGETIGPALMQGISQSRISIVVLSKNYASSSWCLDELLEIFKCKEDGQIVMTVFYGVDPSDVRDKTGDFGFAFNETCARKKDEEKRQKWSKALEDVGNIAGEHFQKWDNESKMIEKIARDVSNKLNPEISWDFEDMVGIEAHLDKMQSLLHLYKEDEVMIVGICGPAGIGKTTIARALYSRLSSNYQLNCFMENIRGITNKGLDEHGLKLRLQEQLLSKILNQNGTRIDHLSALPTRLRDQKVLIVLDDVDDLKQLQALANKTNWFGPGSRIIITTEDRELLEKHDINNTYQVAFPTEEEARKIFCRYAFGKSLKSDGFEKLIKRVTEVCSKLPLGLRVIGSYLCKKTKDDWEDILQGLENSQDPVERDIERLLRVGYDSLREKDQLLFLLIAVFFNHKDDDHVKEMLAKSDLKVRLGLKSLENKSLIQISMEGDIVMHKLLQGVGREAIHRQDPGRRKILIDTDDIIAFLENESDRRSVIGISLDISTILNDVFINARAFKNIHNLQFISIYKSRLDTNVRVHVPEDMDFPHRLRLLHWDDYTAKCLTRKFTPEFLVELSLRESNLEKLWEGIQPLSNLKKMDLYQSLDLKELPDLSNAENLAILKVTNCMSLVELPESIGNLHKLELLEMDYCMSLKVVPTNINLASLREIFMWGCWQLRKIPDISRNITELAIEDTMLEELPDSIRCSLKKLSITSSLSGISSVEKLPDWIKDLHQLDGLCIGKCPNLASLPELPASLEVLTVDTCESLETLTPFSVDSRIREILFHNCLKLDGEARRIISNQKSLRRSCLPGRTIPAEFKQRAFGNSLTIRTDFQLFKICVVVFSNQWLDQCHLLCDIRINGGLVAKMYHYDVSRIKTEHQFMSWGLFSDEFEGWREQDNEIVFEFSTTFPEVDIIECGVQTLSDELIHRYEACSERFSEDEDEILYGITQEINNASGITEIANANGITDVAITDTMLEGMRDSFLSCSFTKVSILGGMEEGDIEKIPDWIKDLHQLKELYIRNCPKLASLPELPASLLGLTVDNCESLETLRSFPVDSPIQYLYFHNCFKLDGEARRVITHQPLKRASLPGRTIPAEFNQRAFGNSLTIRSDFRGVKICVVVSPNEPMVGSGSGILLCPTENNMYHGVIQSGGTLLCEIRLNGCPTEKNIHHEVSMIQSEHLYMFNVVFYGRDGWLHEQDNEISFEFSTTSHELNIIQCGVQTLTVEFLRRWFDNLLKVYNERLSDGRDE